jgi:hypothetical protein
MYGLAKKAEDLGVRILTGLKVTGFETGHNSDAVRAVVTERGTIECEQVVVAVGPWVNEIWNMLELPKSVTITGRDGARHEGIPTWRYWCLEEGTLGVDPNLQKTNDGGMPPVIHVDTDAPLHSDVDGSLITEELWGIYYKPDFNFNGIQGGAAPYKVERPVDEVEIDPYGADSPEFIVDDNSTRWRSTPMGRTRPSSSSTTTSPTCGARPWPSARSASKGRSSTTRKRRPAGSAASRRTASRCSTASGRTSTWSPSTASGRTSTWSPIRTTATR